MRPRGAYGFGMVRTADLAANRPLIGELCELLSRASGVVFYPHNALSYRELGESLERGGVGIAWMPPIPAIDLVDHKSATVLALPVRRGVTSYQSALIGRRGGPKSLNELKGLRVAWVDRESTSGYLVPRMHLIAAGIDPATTFSQELFLHGHGQVVDAVLGGRADVGATFASYDPRTQRIAQAGWTDRDGTNGKNVEVVTTAGPIPNDAVVVATSMPADVRAKVSQWLLDGSSPRVNELFFDLLGAESFRTASTLHFEPLRRMLLASRARGDGPASVRG